MTINASLKPDLDSWVRGEAQRKGKTITAYLTEILEEQRRLSSDSTPDSVKIQLMRLTKMKDKLFIEEKQLENKLQILTEQSKKQEEMKRKSLEEQETEKQREQAQREKEIVKFIENLQGIEILNSYIQSKGRDIPDNELESIQNQLHEKNPEVAPKIDLYSLNIYIKNKTLGHSLMRFKGLKNKGGS